MTRGIAILSLIFLCGLATWIVCRRHESPPTADANGNRSSVAHDVDNISALSRLQVAPSEMVGSYQYERVPSDPPDKRPIAIQGLIELDPPRLASINGDMVVECYANSKKLFEDAVVVTEGRWTMQAPECSVLVMRNLLLEGQAAWTTFADYAVPNDGRLTIRASLEPSYEVRVVDAKSETDVPLIHIATIDETMSQADDQYAHFFHPGICVGQGHRVMHTPVRYPECGPGSYVVTADGYEWAVMTLGPTRPAPGTVRLHESGDIDIFFYGDGDLSRFDNARVELSTAASSLSAIPPPAYSIRLPDRRRSTRICKIRAGVYDAQVVVAPAGVSRTVICQTPVEVYASSTTRLEVVMDSRAAQSSVTEVDGLVYFNDVVDTPPVSAVILQPITVASLTDVGHVKWTLKDNTLTAAGSVYSWAPTPIRPGVYELCVMPMGYVEPVTIQPVPYSQLVVKLPKQKTVTVAFRDELTGLSVQADACWFRCARTREELRERPLTGFSPPPERGEYIFQAYGDYALLQVQASPYGCVRRVLDLTESLEHIVDLSPVARAVVTLNAFGSPLPMRFSWWREIRVEEMGGSGGRLLSIAPHGEDSQHWLSSCVLDMTKRGSYRLEFPRSGEWSGALAITEAVLTDVQPELHIEVDATAAMLQSR